ncbi:MAG TPA: DNA damage-inducible protein D [Ktedonobacterales bacterium]|jgi:DNA-damage-inducible protein D
MPDSGGQSNPFEDIRHTTEDGAEYWSARELGPELGYTRWENFHIAIRRAMTACEVSGYAMSDHFHASMKMVNLGSGAARKLRDYHLSRYACYLVVQNGDPEKPVIAAGQTYFAVQTRRAELADELAALPEAQRRIALRNEVVARNIALGDAAATQAGLVSGQDFATFHDHGYMGLYNGEKARDIAARKGLTSRQKILDWMESEELAANFFRITQTEAQLRRGEATTPGEANALHHQMGADVRRFILEHGGMPPEQLPTPAQSVQQLEKAEQKRIAAEEQAKRQPSLFPPSDDDIQGE